VSPNRVGQRWKDLAIAHVDRLPAVVDRLGIEIGVIAVPARAAQVVADRLVAAGVRGILNFAHRKLFVPTTTTLRNVNLSLELEGLAFAIKARSARPGQRAARRARAY